MMRDPDFDAALSRWEDAHTDPPDDDDASEANEPEFEYEVEPADA